MSILTYPLGFIGGGKDDFYNGVMENSLRFEDGDSPYLLRTPAVAGNRRIWTYSAWVKRGGIIDSAIFGCGTSGTNYFNFRFQSEYLGVVEESSSLKISMRPVAGQTRDPASWMHFVFALNTPANVASERAKMWINGELVTNFSPSPTYPSQDVELLPNSVTPHYHGRLGNSGTDARFDGQLTDIYFIDGHALGPENFAESKNGAWIPKAYEGPVPLVTDSSGKNHEISRNSQYADTQLLNTVSAYIGNSSINVTDLLHHAPRFGPSEDFAFGIGEFTMEFWGYATSMPGSNVSLGADNWQKWGGGTQLATVDATRQISQWWGGSTTFTWSTNTPSAGTKNWTGNMTLDMDGKWAHVSVVRDSDALKVFVNGVQMVANTSGSTANTNFGVGDATHHWVFGTQESSSTSYGWDGYVDELRIIKGEARPPRFYFGTNHGDEDGGRLPQRATTADRFVDDERTVLLVSGHDANNHARAVSLVDESGRHADNVHYSNSTFTNYPTQDGVGKQFTMSGPQHTTREAFIGNTSSIVFDGKDDYLKISSHNFPTADTNRTFDFWVKHNEGIAATTWVFGYGATSGDQAFGISRSSATAGLWRFQGWGSPADFDTTATIEYAQWQHINVTKSGTTQTVYVDGTWVGSGTRTLNTSSGEFKLGSFDGSYSAIYIDEFRASSSVEPPQIKWTHTQTAGAGNKAPYDVDAWRANGHEFTDDNATSLLVHGDCYDTTSDAATGIFKDSSSANSIHHALVAGGGVHHSKAVTMSSDGTNGTSTTDDRANTIYWCDSNSTVTFANSSSFSGYGNTSIRFNGTSDYLTLADSSDWHFGDTANWTISFWFYVINTGSENRLIYNSDNGNSGLVIQIEANLKFKVLMGTGSGWAINCGDNGAAMSVDTWHYLSAVMSGGTSVSTYVDGILYDTNTGNPDDTNVDTFSIGKAPQGWGYGKGYMDELFIEHAANPPRFYLGNQTAESVTTTSNVKYADFNGTNTESSADRWTIANITGAKLEKWSDGQGSSPVTANTGVTWAFWANPDVAANDNIVAKVGGSRMYISSNDAEWAFGADGGSNVQSAKNKVGSWDFVVGVWKQGTAKFYVNGLRAGGHDYTSSSMNLTDSGEDGQLSIGGSTSDELFFDGQIAQFGVWNWELSPEEIMELYNLGIKGNWSVASGAYTHNTSTYMQGYYAMGNHDAVQSSAAQTGGTADTVALIQDRSGNDNDAAQATEAKQPTLSSATTFYEAKTAKRLVQAVEPVTTSYVANNHYANVQAQSVLPQNFGGFVDDEYTVLLLRGGHADGNTVFYDGGVPAGETITFPAHSYSYGKSRVAKSMTVSGATHHEITDTLGLHGSSIDFDGTTDYITFPYHEDFDMKDGNWTIEGWFRHNSSGTYDVQPVDLNYNTYIEFYNSNWLAKVWIGGVERQINGGEVLAQNTWYHIAFQRNKTTLQLFRDGRCLGALTGVTGAHDDYTSQSSGNDYGFVLGRRGSTGRDYDGQIDEFRWTKGICRYTPAGESQSGIVPQTATGAGSTGTSIPTTPYLRPTPFLAADGGRGYFANTNVKLWIKSDSYPGNTTFYDSAGTIGQSAKTITNNGHTSSARPTLQTGTGDYALSGGSDAMLFDGSNDYIEVPSHPNLHVYDGLADFTVEVWYNETAKSTGSNRNPILTIGTGNTNGLPIRAFPSYVSAYIDGGEVYGGGGGAAGLWRHVALQRLNKVKTLFVDGVAVRSSVSSSGPAAAGMKLWIGRDQHSASYQEYFNGKIDELRISKMARYTGQGLIDSDYPNLGTEFGIQTEGSTYGRFDTQITANTTYQRYNYQHHDGWKSYNFDGSNDWIVVPTTIQTGAMYQVYAAWFKTNGQNSGTVPWVIIGDNGRASTTNYAYWMYIDQSDDGKLTSASEPTSQGWAAFAGSKRYDDSQWHLGFLIHDGSTSVKLYADGVFIASGTVTTTNLNNDQFSAGFRIGEQEATSYEFNGSISNVARWKYSSSSALTTKWTDAAIAALYLEGPDANWTTSHSSDMEVYYAMGNHLGGVSGTTADTAATVYDRKSSGTAYNGTTAGSMTAPDSDTKLLIRSNTSHDGNTAIIDSSPSEHLIDRVVVDPVYANTGVSRSVLGSTGISFPTNSDWLEVPDLDMKHFRNRSNAGEFTICWWVKYNSNAINIALDYRAHTQNDGGWSVYSESGEVGFDYDNAGGTGTWGSGLHSSGGATPANTWIHGAVVQTGTAITLYKNASVGETESSGRQMLDAAGTYRSLIIGGGYNSGGTRQATTINGHLDQVLIYSGFGMSSPQLTALYNSGNGKASIGTLGGLILHEEYEDGTNTANAATHLILHSNNATHHTHGSRNFYSDTANCRFTTTTGHEAAGRFTIGAASGYFTVLGAHQTGYSPAMQNPSIRLRRGYSYIFSASSLSSHKFYFANSTSDYAASGTLANQYIGGQYGTNSSIDGTETWTAFSAGHFLGGGGTSGEWNHMKFEVPADAPKDLYYRCAASGHGAMGNAVFVMESTEPASVKVGELPALRTSTWNDRDYAGIGTNKSVAHFLGGTALHYLQIADHDDWSLGSGDFTIEFWTNSTKNDYQRVICHTDHNGGGTKEGWNLFIDQDSGCRLTWSTDGDNEANMSLNDDGLVKINQWTHWVLTRNSTNAKVYVNGKLADTSTSLGSATIYNSTEPLTIGAMKQSGSMTTSAQYEGFLDGLALWTSEHSANTVIEHYQKGRAGEFLTANSSMKLYIKADSYYGNTVFTDASPSAHTITNIGGVYHHIDDNRTANTALYFDGYSFLRFPNTTEMKLGADGNDYCIEAWIKPKQGNGFLFYSAAGTSYNGATNDEGLRISINTNGGAGATYDYQIEVNEQVSNNDNQTRSGSTLLPNAWNHVCVQRIAHLHSGYVQILINGVLVALGSAAGRDLDGQSDMSIGGRLAGPPTPSNSFVGWMDGIRITNGMPRYTSGIPTDGQDPHKHYSDGRSSNTANAQWTSSSTRKHYGINTHTYLQTTKYATDANTVLLIRGDDAETANDGVNMYGDNGFHLEFKEVGAGTERDYSNYNTGVNGFGSDTSATSEFADDATVFLLRSRPNQANGVAAIINETKQNTDRITVTGTYHSSAESIFNVDSNTANVSIASGGSREY